MASIQAMLATQGNAAPASPSQHLADARESDFHAVLASYASAAQPAQQIVSRDAHADKSLKAIDRSRPSTGEAKVSRKDARSEEKAAKKSELKSDKASANAQPVVPVEPPRAPAPVHTTAAPQSAANGDHESDDTYVVEHSHAERTTSPKTAAMPSSENRPASRNPSNNGTGPVADPQAEAPVTQANGEDSTKTQVNTSARIKDRPPANSLNTPVQSSALSNAAEAQPPYLHPSNQRTSTNSQNRYAQPNVRSNAPATGRNPVVETRDPAVATSPQSSPLKISGQALDEAIVVAKSDAKQPTENAAPQPAPNTAPGVVRTLAANVTAMLNAMRGSMTVSSPKQAAPATADVKPAATAAAKAAPSDLTPQPSHVTEKAAQNIQNNPITRSVRSAQVLQNDAREAAEMPKAQDLSVSDNVLKANVATVDVATSDVARTNSAATTQIAQNAPRDVSEDQNRAAPDNGANTDAAKAVAVRANVAAATPPVQANSDAALNASKPESRLASHHVQTGNAKTDASPSGSVRVDAAPAATTPANPAPQAVASSQPSPPAAQIADAPMPNAVNATPASQASAAPHRLSADFQAESAPNISALATAIAAKSSAGTKTFDIRMDPPELGRVDVHLSVDRDGKVQAMLSAEHPQTLALLQKDSHNLERALKDAGLDLSNNSLNFSLKGEGRQGDGGGASMARARSLPDAVVARAEAANASLSSMRHTSGDGRLDIRV